MRWARFPTALFRCLVSVSSGDEVADRENGTGDWEEVGRGWRVRCRGFGA